MTDNIQRITIELPDTLARRLSKDALANFETLDSYIPIVLAGVVPDKRRHRDGGKSPAKRLLRPVPPHYKRGRILDWLRTAPEPTVSGAARHFRMTRNAVLMTLVTLNTVHGIGYAVGGRTDRVAIIMP